MPHGQRDWSNIGAEETVHGLADMAELAARLGSPDTFNREGNVLDIETWEHGFGEWSHAAPGAASSIYISAERSRHGAYAVKMVCGADANRTAYVTKRFPYPVPSRFGVEFSFQVTGDLEEVRLTGAVYDGSNLYAYMMRLYDVTDVVQYWTTGGAWSTLATGVVVTKYEQLFHTLKLVVDLTAGTYRRVIFDDTEWNMESLVPRIDPSTTDAHIFVSIQFMSETGKSCTAYLDDVVITQNEP